MNRRNNFDFVRMVAALAVLLSHAWPLHSKTFPLGDLGAFGVFIFFAISGYLVSASWDRDPSVVRFALRRMLRILPGLVTSILVAAVIIGPLVTPLPLGQYFSHPQFFSYCRSVLLFPMSFHLPLVFHTNPYPDEVNGSLWTLPIEVFMYAALAGMSKACSAFRLSITALWTTVLVSSYAMEIKGVSGAWLTMDALGLCRNASAFAVGALLWQWRYWIRFVHWAWLPVCVFLVAARGAAVEIWVLLVGVPYAAVSFSVAAYPVISHAGKWGDPSYGLYIYAFLIQQTLMYAFPAIGMKAFIGASIVLSFAAGYMSWHIIEKRVMRMKRFLKTNVIKDVATPA